MNVTIENEIVQKIKDGKRRDDIAKAYGITLYAVVTIARANGLFFGNCASNISRQQAAARRYEEVVDLLQQRKTISEVAGLTGYSKGRVYQISEMMGVELYRVVTPEIEARVKSMINDGMSRKAISSALGISVETVRTIARNNQLRFSTDMRGVDFEGHAREAVEQRNPGFEYVSGYSNWTSTITLRCKTCGTLKHVKYNGAARQNVRCVECVRRESEARQAQQLDEKQKKREAKREERKAEREALRKEQKAQQLKEREHPCVVCGAITTKPKYCCQACANKAANKSREIKRRLKIDAAMVDKDITLEAVWRNNLGVCYICGKVCDWNDKQEVDGTIICGDNYPSIDHYVPLSKGGEHSWKNVLLACRGCNSAKSDTLPRPRSRRAGT